MNQGSQILNNKNSARSISQKEGHFKQFFNHNSAINGRYSRDDQYHQQQQPKDKIDLENFSKFVSSPTGIYSKTRLPFLSTEYQQSQQNNQQQQQYQTQQAGLRDNKNTNAFNNVNQQQFQEQMPQQQQQYNNNLEISQIAQENSKNTTINNNSKLTNISAISGAKGKNSLNSSSNQPLNRSYFFNGPERFVEDVNLNYFDHGEINPLVDTKKEYQFPQNLEYSKIFEVPQKQFIPEKLYMNDESLKNSKERINELREVKSNLELLRQYKQEKDSKNKSYKLTKSAFRSGVTHLDGPLTSETQIYQQENQRLQRRQSEEETRRQARLSYIEKYVTTNPAILFDNRISSKFEQKKVMPFPRQVDEFKNGFLERQKNPSAQQYNAQSFDRIFGHNLEDQKQNVSSLRSKFLCSKDVYGKPQNIISNTVNPTIGFVS